jgi:hypothetical protein
MSIVCSAVVPYYFYQKKHFVINLLDYILHCAKHETGYVLLGAKRKYIIFS